MEQVLAHFKEYYPAYVLSFLCLIPMIYATRKYSVPLIQYSLETLIYITAMHVVMWCLVAITRWFKEQSSMKYLQADGRPVDAPTWGTPFIEFWNKELYDPQWLAWVELGAVVVIFLLVLKFRPLRIQRSRGWRFNDKSQKKGSPKPPPASYGARMGSSRGGKR